MKEIITISLVAVVVLGGLVFFIVKADQARNETMVEKYQECKQRTDDVEWCFIQFRPYLENYQPNNSK